MNRIIILKGKENKGFCMEYFRFSWYGKREVQNVIVNEDLDNNEDK